MTELVHERPVTITDEAGTVYDRIRVYAEPHGGDRWAGLIEFVGTDHTAVRTAHETTQSSIADVAYWATGLEATYFEGALDRARRPRRTVPADDPQPLAWRSALLEIRGGAAALPLRVMDTRTLAPGWRRPLHKDSVIVYEATLEPMDGGASRYAFLVQFRSENGAALAANAIWSAIHDDAVDVLIEGTPVPIRHDALKQELLRAGRTFDAAA